MGITEIPISFPSKLWQIVLKFSRVNTLTLEEGYKVTPLAWYLFYSSQNDGMTSWSLKNLIQEHKGI